MVISLFASCEKLLYIVAFMNKFISLIQYIYIDGSKSSICMHQQHIVRIISRGLS